MSLAPLSAAALASIEREAELLELDTLGWWALGALGALMPSGFMWCLVDRRRFLRAGGPGWRELGYTLDQIEGQEWLGFISSDPAESLSAMDENLLRGKGLLGFANRYHLADRSGTREVVWTATPWSGTDQGHSVALGILR